MQMEEKRMNAMTNGERIRKLTDEELAELLIKTEHEPEFDYDYEENMVYSGDSYYFKASNGEKFDDYKDALKETVNWLKEEAAK